MPPCLPSRRAVVRPLGALLALAALLFPCGPSSASPAAAQPHAAEAPARAGRWYAVQLHAHSRHSDGMHSIAELRRWAREGGLDALAVTDHNTERHLTDAAFGEADGVLMLPAFEWTSSFRERREDGVYAHANVWGLRPGQLAELPETLAPEALVRAAHARGLLVGVNHPYEPRYPWPEDDVGEADAVEVWHWQYGFDEAEGTALPENAHRPHAPGNDFLLRNARALEGWQRALRAGRRPTPLAVADFHVLGQQIESPCTLIWAETRSVEALLAGLRAGHVALVERPRGPRVELWADADGDGRFEAMAGDTVAVGTRLQLRVLDGTGLTLGLYDAHGRVRQEPVPSADWRHEWRAERAGFYWARLDEIAWTNPFKLNALKAMSGAMFVRS